MSLLDAVAHGGNPQDRAASLPQQNCYSVFFKLVRYKNDDTSDNCTLAFFSLMRCKIFFKSSLFPLIEKLFLPCSLFPVPCSLFPVPCSLFPNKKMYLK
ncbi:hypothetical protein [Moorena sp. SIO3H5]|uniref:hypothetical protein n=1 Tax=Moorena sp. SIO3H5 TaxID=2607834 RepID=UPI0013B60692|nr:hypothetical protein [Moorena sp. SIO3H5]NEO68506.1 hypothetical protein [Moorena sp. SIO3H5]